MTPHPFTQADLDALGMLGATKDDVRGTLTFHFTNRDETWMLAPPGYPTDGSCEVMLLAGVAYVPPPRGPAS